MPDFITIHSLPPYCERGRTHMPAIPLLEGRAALQCVDSLSCDDSLVKYSFASVFIPGPRSAAVPFRCGYLIAKRDGNLGIYSDSANNPAAALSSWGRSGIPRLCSRVRWEGASLIDKNEYECSERPRRLMPAIVSAF